VVASNAGFALSRPAVYVRLGLSQTLLPVTPTATRSKSPRSNVSEPSRARSKMRLS